MRHSLAKITNLCSRYDDTRKYDEMGELGAAFNHNNGGVDRSLEGSTEGLKYERLQKYRRADDLGLFLGSSLQVSRSGADTGYWRDEPGSVSTYQSYQIKP